MRGDWSHHKERCERLQDMRSHHVDSNAEMQVDGIFATITGGTLEHQFTKIFVSVIKSGRGEVKELKEWQEACKKFSSILDKKVRVQKSFQSDLTQRVMNIQQAFTGNIVMKERIQAEVSAIAELINKSSERLAGKINSSEVAGLATALFNKNEKATEKICKRIGESLDLATK